LLYIDLVPCSQICTKRACYLGARNRFIPLNPKPDFIDVYRMVVYNQGSTQQWLGAMVGNHINYNNHVNFFPHNAI